MTEQLRVALLARAGAARDQLHRALEEVGALIVAEGDPGELDPKDVSEKLPKVFLVSLEPATEKSIERFDSLFEAEGIEVMFDDAEVTGKLDGWDLNRWARHLAGKLTGSATLPPVPAGAPAIGEFVEHEHDAGTLLQPGLPTTPAEQMASAKLEDYTFESPELAEWVPTSPSLTDAPKPEEAAADEAFSWDGSQTATGDGGRDTKEFKLDTDLGIDVDLASLEFAPSTDAAPAVVDEYAAQDIPDLPDMPSGEGVRFSTFDAEASSEQTGDLDADVAALAAQLEAFEKEDTRGAAIEPEFTRTRTKEEEAIDQAAMSVKAKGTGKPAGAAATGAAAVTPTSPSGKGSFNFNELSLASMDEESDLAKAPPIAPKFNDAVELIPEQAKSFSSMLSLEGDASGAGAVLILAGLGGPDAVRQLLSSLPTKLAVPVLLYQHLEVGKHERLVEQLAKISKLPVTLAREGEKPAVGCVSLLPAGLTATSGPDGLEFVAGNLPQLVSALPPPASMVIVLSGADAQLVPMILAVKDGGGIVLAQDPELCFDAAAAEAMRKEGAKVFAAVNLAQQVSARWPV